MRNSEYYKRAFAKGRPATVDYDDWKSYDNGDDWPPTGGATGGGEIEQVIVKKVVEYPSESVGLVVYKNGSGSKISTYDMTSGGLLGNHNFPDGEPWFFHYPIIKQQTMQRREKGQWGEMNMPLEEAQALGFDPSMYVMPLPSLSPVMITAPAQPVPVAPLISPIRFAIP